MPTYFYTAKSQKGESRTGERTAKSERDLARALHQEGYVLISAASQEPKTRRTRFSISLPFLSRVSLTEKMLFTRNLQVMVAAGLSLPRAMKTLAGQVKSRTFKNALQDIEEQISKGNNFSQSLSRHPKIFNQLFQNMVKVGEETGTLEKVLKTLARQMERTHLLQSRIKGAMMYPAVIVAAMLGIGILMLIIVVPKLSDTFEELGIDLPITTQFIINLGNFLANFWYLVPIIIFVLFIILRAGLALKPVKRAVDLIFLKAPIISPIVRKTNSAYTTRTLSSLIAAGVPIVRSLEIVSDTLANVYFKEAIVETAKKVRKGAGLSESLANFQNVYPSLVVQMVKVGEETGQTSEILAKLALFFEEEVSNATKNLASVIEPVLMIIIGAAVGFFAVSMIQPMYSMLGSL